MSRASRRRSRWPVLAAAVALLAASCSGTSHLPSGDMNRSAAAPASDQADALPIRVSGIERCDELRRTTRSATRWSKLVLPCLTTATNVDLSRLHGKPTLINLWASWCGPCRTEMPVLQRGHQTYRRSMTFVGVDTKDSARVAVSFLKEVGATYPELYDAEGRLLAQERIPGLPVTLLIDSKGELVDRHVGPLDQPGLARFVRPALGTRLPPR